MWINPEIMFLCTTSVQLYSYEAFICYVCTFAEMYNLSTFVFIWKPLLHVTHRFFRGLLFSHLKKIPQSSDFDLQYIYI